LYLLIKYKLLYCDIHFKGTYSLFVLKLP